jgi:anaerobic magnesium-protoporphyrin IX monomethyl ester cyclase
MISGGRGGSRVLLVVSESRVDEYLGVGYLAAALRLAGFEVEVFQATDPEHVERLVARLRSADPVSLIGVTWLYDASAPLAANVARLVKDIRPRVPVVVGGHPPSLSPQQALSLAPDVDYVLRGECDRSLVDLATVLDGGGGELDAVPGIAFRVGPSVFVGTAPSQIADVDSLQRPARDTLEHVLARAPDPRTVVARLCGSRGCYARCEFCSMVSFYNLDGAGMKWRHRSAGSIVDEIDHLVDIYGVRRFWFVDDEFLGSPKEQGKQAIEIASRILDRGIDIEWGFDARANGVEGMPDGGLELLRSSGVRVVAMGLESGSQAALRRLNKGMRVKSNWQAVKRLREAGIEHRFGFIMYDPGTTLDDLQLNVEFIRFAEPHRICNTGPYRLLNAEYPEVGTPLAIRLGIGSTTAEALAEQNKPKLSDAGLGYDFDDSRVGRIRQALFEFARRVVEPAMTPRPPEEPSLLSEVWWEGTNYLPENVAAMNAFLDVYEWVLALETVDPVLADEAESLFDRRFADHLGAAAMRS